MSIQSNFPSVKPSLLLDFQNTKQLDPRISFSRASTATFYNGVTTAMAEQNLALYSQEANSWTKQNATATANSTTAPDGTSTADTITFDTTSGEHYVYPDALNASTISTYTFSFYAKNVDQNFVQIAVGNNASLYVNFDISTGVVGTSSNAISSSITSVGSGWYRCVATFTTASANGFLVVSGITSSTSSRIPVYSQASSKSFYIWGAQVEQRSAVTAYTATTTQAITNYIPVLQTAASGVARFDNNPTTGESLGLLIEESRTNLATYSSDLSNAAWTKSNSTITADTIIAPDGTLTGDKFVENTSTTNHQLYSGFSTSVQSYTWSVYAKAGERQYLSLGFSGSSIRYAWFDLVAGTTSGASNCTSAITPVGNGFYRCSITATALAETTFAQMFLGTSASGYAPSYTGNGFSGIFVWGAQLEAGAFATSYIPTVASQVTRAADAASMTGTNFSSWYNTQQGTIYANAVSNGDKGAYQFAMELTNSTRGDAFAISKDTSNLVRYQALGLTGTAFNTTDGAWTNGSDLKIALAMSNSSSAGDKNGGTIVSGSTPTVLPIPTQMGIGCASNASSNYWNGTIKKLAYYPIRVTNTQLQALTS